ncbi:MAG: hypothetical protein ABJE95_34300 [Byssovorax sp.]
MRSQTRLLLSSLVVGSLAAGVAMAGCGGGDTGTGSSAGTASTSGGGNPSSTGTTGLGGAGGSFTTGSGGASTGTVGTAGTASTGASMPTSTGSGPMMIAACQGHVYECGDLLDNDGDGLIDADDPDCLGPCDNTEGSFYGGIPGQAGPACTVDCYFDQDSGSGNDDCHWSHKCDPHETAPGYYPESKEGNKCAYDKNANTPGSGGTCDELYATQSQACHDYCGPLTPNGCDCFGCCELPAGKGKYVWLGSEDANGNGSCSLAVLDDPAKCQPCLPVQGCLNHCDPCELCIGKTTLPPECNPGTGGSGSTGAGTASTGSATTGSATTGSATTGSGGGMQCDTGVQACGLPGQGPCPNNFYCITGCCQQIPG